MTVTAFNAKFVVRPERRNEFLKVLQNDGKQTISTGYGSLQFVLGEDTDKPNVFHLHEQYLSRDALISHAQTPQWKKFTETDPFVEGPVLELWSGGHEPTKVPMREAFCLNAELCIQPEFREDFLNVMENAQKCSIQEPLCLQYQYGESTTTRNTFYVHQEYTGANGGKEGFDVHKETPHYRIWEEFSDKDPFSKPPVAGLYRSIGPDSNEQ